MTELLWLCISLAYSLFSAISMEACLKDDYDMVHTIILLIFALFWPVAVLIYIIEKLCGVIKN